MQRNFFRFLFFYASAIFLFLNWHCTKIDTTQLGADLLPAVDNVSTFADTLKVIGSKGVYTDTPKISRLDNHALGSINNDPIFGKTEANIYFQLKPSFFPFYFGNSGDTIKDVDSVVLCLSYKKFYGDSNLAQHFRVYELDPDVSFVDTVTYRIDFQPQALGNLLGEATVTASALKDYTFFNHGKDSINNQIRIKLSSSFANTLISYDSSGNNTFHSDSLFKLKYKGFAVVADKTFGGNGLFYVSLTDTATRLEIYHRSKNAIIDTSFSRFTLSTGATISPSATANYINRDMTGSEVSTNPGTDALYILSAPGTSVELSIPGLDNFKNSIIHRAELVLEQVPGDPLTDQYLSAPSYLYADLVDTSAIKKYKPVFYDLSPTSTYDPNSSVSFFPTNGIDFNYFGGLEHTKTDPFSGRQISYYTFNLTRYVQNLITKHGTNYKLRITAPYSLNYYGYSLAFNNRIAYGRIKIGNWNNPHYMLRMRIVYSKL